DTVAWKINGDELHTVSFVAGAKDLLNPVPLQNGDPDEMIPFFAAPVPGGKAGDAQLNPQVAFPTRAPGAPVETYSGPAKFVSSGILAKQPPMPGAPLNDTFSVTFDKPGTYKYVCLIHLDTMRGVVEVLPSDTRDVPDQAAIDARAKTEIVALTAL